MDVSLMLSLSLGLFWVGILGLLTKRNVLIFFLSIELLLNSANLLFVTFASMWGNQIGLVWVFFVLVIAAVEAAVGMAIVIHLFRSKQSVDVDQYDGLKG